MRADSAIPFGTFVRKLKDLNPKIVVPLNEGHSKRGVMVYLRLPRHPDSHPLTGLWEILALPAPWFYPMTPKHDTERRSLDGSGKWVRGWGTFLKAVKRMKDPSTGRLIFDPKRVKGLFPRPYDGFNSQQFKAELNERNLSPEARNYKKLRGALRAF